MFRFSLSFAGSSVCLVISCPFAAHGWLQKKARSSKTMLSRSRKRNCEEEGRKETNTLRIETLSIIVYSTYAGLIFRNKNSHSIPKLHWQGPSPFSSPPQKPLGNNLRLAWNRTHAPKSSGPTDKDFRASPPPNPASLRKTLRARTSNWYFKESSIQSLEKSSVRTALRKACLLGRMLVFLIDLLRDDKLCPSNYGPLVKSHFLVALRLNWTSHQTLYFRRSSLRYPTGH